VAVRFFGEKTDPRLEHLAVARIPVDEFGLKFVPSFKAHTEEEVYKKF
jgi:hypothetical protein